MFDDLNAISLIGRLELDELISLYSVFLSMYQFASRFTYRCTQHKEKKLIRVE